MPIIISRFDSEDAVRAKLEGFSEEDKDFFIKEVYSAHQDLAKVRGHYSPLNMRDRNNKRLESLEERAKTALIIRMDQFKKKTGHSVFRTYDGDCVVKSRNTPSPAPSPVSSTSDRSSPELIFRAPSPIRCASEPADLKSFKPIGIDPEMKERASPATS